MNLQEQISRILEMMGVIKENLTFYHGGLSPDARLSDIDVFRLSSRQQKKGRDYAGFYMSPDIEADSFALQYHKSNEGSGLHKITLPSDAKAYEYPSPMERITRTELIDLFEKGYDYISGKNLFGNPEYVLLNKNIANLELVSNDTGDDETSYRLDIDSDNDGTLEEMKEGELTEKCWKGYTQKGMKTMFGKRYPNCVKKKSKTLKESKASKEDYSDIETVINKIIPKSFSWFKEIEIDKISYAEFSNTLTIYGELKVDEEWGAKQWRRYYDYKPFPSNSGWEEEDPVRLGDIIGKGEIDDLNDLMEVIVSSVGNYSTIDTIRLGQLKLYFV